MINHRELYLEYDTNPATSTLYGHSLPINMDGIRESNQKDLLGQRRKR